MSAIMLTFGEQSENHVGMQMNGNGLADSGYTYADLKRVRDVMKEKECKTKIYNLHKDMENVPKAYVLHVKDAVQALINNNTLFDQLTNIEWVVY